MFGDVFVCSGQSNMWWTIQLSSNPQIEVELSLKFPNVRMFTVGQNQPSQPLEDISTSTGWLMPSATNTPNFSAVCYVFGQKLNSRLNVPIGLIASSVGGSPIEQWMSKDAHTVCGAVAPTNSFWNGMIFPLLRYKVIGALWYQGESNAGNWRNYVCQYKSMVQDWRLKFQENLLYLSVQLAGFNNGDFTDIRGVQYLSISSIPNTGMATAVDLGHPTDIHPKNKREVSERLELIAANLLYGFNSVDYYGPIFSKVEIERQASNVLAKVFFLNSNGGFDLKPTDNCTTCCSVQSDIFQFVSGAKIFSTTIQINSDFILLRSVIPQSDKIDLIRTNWSKFPQCSLINKRTKIASPAHFSGIN